MSRTSFKVIKKFSVAEKSCCEEKAKHVCVNKKCKLRKAGCQGSPSCPGYKEG